MTHDSANVDTTKERQSLVLTLASAMRTAAYYAPDNAVMREACANLARALAQHMGEDASLRIGVHSHTVYCNTNRVPFSVSTFKRFSYLVQLFENWSASGLVFLAGLTSEELMRALVLLASSRVDQETDLSDILRRGGVERVVVDYTVPGRGTRSTMITPIVAYTAAMQLGADLGEMSGPYQAGTVRRVRHVTQAVVDQILRDPSSLLALTTVKDFDRYLVLHSTNVAVLSTLLGQRLGLDKPKLGELCLAGFLHDAGKLGVDPDVLHKPAALDPKEWEEMRRHPILAAYALLGGRRLSSADMRAVVVAFEHHLNYDLSGYPAVELKNRMTLYGSIVAIADCFDALTTARVYRKVNPTPAEAIAHLAKLRGTQFDSTLVKLFIEVMGIYPPGTVLALTGREAGVVARAPIVGAPLDRPTVRLVVGREPGKVVDLNERVNGAYVRNVVAVLNPANKGQIPALDPASLRKVHQSANEQAVRP
jgi:HD-GYP domain-containing protein (c-di-GMP phosphodiesterase class II)